MLPPDRDAFEHSSKKCFNMLKINRTVIWRVGKGVWSHVPHGYHVCYACACRPGIFIVFHYTINLFKIFYKSGYNFWSCYVALKDFLFFYYNYSALSYCCASAVESKVLLRHSNTFKWLENRQYAHATSDIRIHITSAIKRANGWEGVKNTLFPLLMRNS